MRYPTTIYDDDENEIKLPTKRVVCFACDGGGVTTSHIEPDGGGFTSDEWQYECQYDEEFSRNYMSGMYDRPCPDCKGMRVVDVADRGKMSKELLEMYDLWCDEEDRHFAECEAERRAGC